MLSQLLVTSDFLRVIKSEAKIDKLDDFLRPLRWLLHVGYESCWIGVSAFEASRLLPSLNHGLSLHLWVPRIWPDQSRTLIDSAAHTQPYCKVDLGEGLQAQIAVLSGSLYFKSDDEQQEYANFLGLCLRPRTEVQEQAARRGKIASDGFVPASYRSEVAPDLVGRCRFDDSPISLVHHIWSATRREALAVHSHAGSVVLQCTATDIDKSKH